MLNLFVVYQYTQTHNSKHQPTCWHKYLTHPCVQCAVFSVKCILCSVQLAVWHLQFVVYLSIFRTNCWFNNIQINRHSNDWGNHPHQLVLCSPHWLDQATDYPRTGCWLQFSVCSLQFAVCCLQFAVKTVFIGRFLGLHTLGTPSSKRLYLTVYLEKSHNMGSITFLTIIMIISPSAVSLGIEQGSVCMLGVFSLKLRWIFLDILTLWSSFLFRLFPWIRFLV